MLLGVRHLKVQVTYTSGQMIDHGAPVTSDNVDADAESSPPDKHVDADAESTGPDEPATSDNVDALLSDDRVQCAAYHNSQASAVYRG